MNTIKRHYVKPTSRTIELHQRPALLIESVQSKQAQRQDYESETW